MCSRVGGLGVRSVGRAGHVGGVQDVGYGDGEAALSDLTARMLGHVRAEQEGSAVGAVGEGGKRMGRHARAAGLHHTWSTKMEASTLIKKTLLIRLYSGK